MNHWVKSITFYGPCPQPDHTYGSRWSNFTEVQRKKLNIESIKKSYYAAREEIYLPILTSEVRQGLYLADRRNTHSMAIALRGIIDFYRRASRIRSAQETPGLFDILQQQPYTHLYLLFRRSW